MVYELTPCFSILEVYGVLLNLLDLAIE